jgi:hypothetical protein
MWMRAPNRRATATCSCCPAQTLSCTRQHGARLVEDRHVPNLAHASNTPSTGHGGGGYAAGACPPLHALIFPSTAQAWMGHRCTRLGHALAVLVEALIVLHVGLKVCLMLPHEADRLLPELQVVPSRALQHRSFWSSAIGTCCVQVPSMAKSHPPPVDQPRP